MSVRVRLVMVEPPNPEEKELCWLTFPVEPPQQGLMTYNDIIVQIIGTRWECSSEEGKEPYLLVAVATQESIKRALAMPAPAGLVSPDGRRLM